MIGSQLFLKLLNQEGVSLVFGNPGTTELPLMDAFAAEEHISYVLTLQEAVAMAMADGYARASGGLGVVSLHVAPGLGNAIGMLYDAQKAGAPLIVLAGQQAQGFGLTEPNLYAELPPIAAPFVKWATEVRSAADLPRIIHRAAKVALAPPTGPVFVSLPTDVLLEKVDVDLGRPSRVAPLFRADPSAVREAGRLLAHSERPVIIAGDAVSQSNAHAELAELAELLGAPVYLEGESNSNGFPTSHPLCAGHLVRSAKVIRGVLDKHDVLFSVGGDLFTLSLPPVVEPVPSALTVIHLDTDPWQLAKNYPTAPAMMGDPKTTLPEISEAVRSTMTTAQASKASTRLAATRSALAAATAELVAEAQAAAKDVPFAPLAVMHAVGDVLPANAIVIDEAVSSGRGLRHFLRCDRADSYHGIRGGGIGWGLPGAVGVKLAHPDRPVVALVGDGSAMYTPQALWTAGQCNVGVVFVILVNRNYNILHRRLTAMQSFSVQANKYVGMELRPDIDYVGLARSLGVEAHAVPSLQQFRELLGAGIRSKGPVLLEVQVARAEVG